MSGDSIDWDAAVSLAAQLGRRTLQLVAERDAEGLREFCLRMLPVYAGGNETNAVHALTYYELAVIAGHRPPPAQDRKWRQLLQAAQELVAEVRVKADAEKAESAKAAEERARATVEQAEQVVREAADEALGEGGEPE